MAQRWSAGQRLGASVTATDVPLQQALPGRIFALFAGVILVVGGPAAGLGLPLVAGVLLACGCVAVGGGLLRLVFAAPDPKAGACGSLYNLCADPRLNHEVAVSAGVLADQGAEILRRFFAGLRDTPERPVT